MRTGFHLMAWLLAGWLAGCRPPDGPVAPPILPAQTARQAQTWLRQPDRWQLSQMWFGSQLNPTRVLIYQAGQAPPSPNPPNLQWMRLKDDNTAQFKYDWNAQPNDFLYKVDDVANQLVLYQTNIFNPTTSLETWYIKSAAVYPTTFEMTFVSPGDSYTLSFSAVP